MYVAWWGLDRLLMTWMPLNGGYDFAKRRMFNILQCTTSFLLKIECFWSYAWCIHWLGFDKHSLRMLVFQCRDTGLSFLIRSTKCLFDLVCWHFCSSCRPDSIYKISWNSRLNFCQFFYQEYFFTLFQSLNLSQALVENIFVHCSGCIAYTRVFIF